MVKYFDYKKTAFLLLFIGIFEPEYFTRFAALNYLFRAAYYLGIIGMTFDLFRSGIKISRTVICTFGIYYAALLISTLLYSGVQIMLLKSFLKTAAISILLLNFIYVNMKENCSFFLFCLAEIGELLLVANLVSVLIFPDGLYRTGSTNVACYLLGHKNQTFTVLILPLFAHAIYYGNTGNNKCSKRTFAFIGLLFITSCLANASMAMVCSLVIFVLLQCLPMKWFRRFADIRLTTISMIAMNFAICILRIQNLFSFIIVDLLNKDITLTSRTYIWDNAMAFIRENRIWGVGYEFALTIIKQLSLSGTHNMIVGILFHSGLVGVLIWTGIMIRMMRAVLPYKMTLAGNAASVFMLVYLIQGISENILQPMKENTMLLLLTMLFCIPTYAGRCIRGAGSMYGKKRGSVHG